MPKYPQNMKKGTKIPPILFKSNQYNPTPKLELQICPQNVFKE